jgi:long-chain fatty acid transport protein
VLAAALFSVPAHAINGARLIGQGTASRSMGGVGVAMPQDTIAAWASNPAAAAFLPITDEFWVDFAVSVLAGGGSATLDLQEGSSFGSDKTLAPVFNNALLLPAPQLMRGLLLGFSTTATGGFGVDYRNDALDQPSFFDLGGGKAAPLTSGLYSRFQAVTLAMDGACSITDWLSVGVAPSLVLSSLDLRSGTSAGTSVGVQVGVAGRPHENVALGASYSITSSATLDKVTDLDADGRADVLKSQLPQVVALGAAVSVLEKRILIETDLRWLGWSHAAGFADNDWRDQWVVALGAQARLSQALALRAGYNYGRQPVRVHNDFDGTAPVSVGGTHVPQYYFETARLIGIPALTQHHITAGFVLEVLPLLSLAAGAVLTPAESLREQGSDVLGRGATITAHNRVSFSVEFGLSFKLPLPKEPAAQGAAAPASLPRWWQPGAGAASAR